MIGFFRRAFSGDTGLWGECLAERHLKGKRYRILGRRVRIGKHDEIDIVARDGATLVFVEVKTRAKEDYGRPASSIDRRKRRALMRAAVGYLKKIGFRADSFRFDVVEVIGKKEGKDQSIRHIENAFNLDERYFLPY